MRVAWGLCLAALLALLATATTGVYPVRGRAHRVEVVSFAFEPRVLTIEAGDRVEWSFRAAGHSVTAENGEWASGVRDADDSFARRFATPGAFAYFCRPHDFMRGTIAVRPRSRWRAIWFWSLALGAAAAAAAALRARRAAKLSTLRRTPNIRLR